MTISFILEKWLTSILSGKPDCAEYLKTPSPRSYLTRLPLGGAFVQQNKIPIMEHCFVAGRCR